MASVRALALGLMLTVGLAACGSSPDTAASVVPASGSPGLGASAASKVPAAAASVAPAASPSVSPVTETSSPASPAVAPGAPAGGSSAGASSASGVKLTLVSEGSQVQIHMRELLAGNAVQNDAIETGKAVSGAIIVNADGSVAPGSTISLDLRTLSSDRASRDRFIKSEFVLNTSQWPNAEVTITEVQGLSLPLPTSGQQSFKMLGTATVHGVTKPLTWTVNASCDPQNVQGQATADFTLSEFGLPMPKAGPVVSVADAGKLVASFDVTRSGG